MSHVAIVEVEINDLEALKAACADLGLSFMEGQTTYNWFGRSVGDYPLPAGFTAEDLGHCTHALSLGTERRKVTTGVLSGRQYDGPPFEIGVTPRRDGKPGWTLLWDFYYRGYGLEDAIGTGAKKLIDRYAVNVTKREACSGTP